MFKSTDVNLQSCLVCLLDKMADSALWFVRSPVNQAPGEGAGAKLCSTVAHKEQDWTPVLGDMYLC